MKVSWLNYTSHRFFLNLLFVLFCFVLLVVTSESLAREQNQLDLVSHILKSTASSLTIVEREALWPCPLKCGHRKGCGQVRGLVSVRAQYS